MLNYFNFKQFNDDCFLNTNDFGLYEFLNKEEFYALVKQDNSQPAEFYEELAENGFIINEPNKTVWGNNCTLLEKQRMCMEIMNPFYRKKHGSLNYGLFFFSIE